tara:strand:- start:399 stop:1268 length:870 start_codon:yes stop_codon:yes gene_type:complete
MLYVWTSDRAKNSGEGKLARMFIEYLIDKNNYKIKFNTNQQQNYNRYISPFIGILYCWKNYLKKRKVAYINYLPFWNCFIFILLPPKTILGPITGGALFNKNSLFNYLIRKHLFNLLYKISELIINIRFSNLIFSTDLLKKYLSKKTIKKSNFNFVFTNFVIKKAVKKKIDFLIYYRKHKNKEKFFPYNLIQKLINLNFQINIIGDKLDIPSVRNFGRVSNKKVSKLQSIARYTIASGENPYSFFILESLSNNMKIIINKNSKYKIKFHKLNFIEINFNDAKYLKKIKV